MRGGVELAGEAVVVAGAAAGAYALLCKVPATGSWSDLARVAAAAALVRLVFEASGANAWYIARKNAVAAVAEMRGAAGSEGDGECEGGLRGAGDIGPATSGRGAWAAFGDGGRWD